MSAKTVDRTPPRLVPPNMNNTPATIELSPAILRAIAVGLDRLNDGDLSDCAARDEAEATLARAGYIASNGRCYPAANANSGYVHGVYVYVTYDGTWSSPNVEPGDSLYLDEACTVLLRTV